MKPSDLKALLCASGRHSWTDEQDRRRCCAGYVRVQSNTREGLEEIGAEHIVFRQLFRGWMKERP